MQFQILGLLLPMCLTLILELHSIQIVLSVAEYPSPTARIPIRCVKRLISKYVCVLSTCLCVQILENAGLTYFCAKLMWHHSNELMEPDI